MEQKELHYRGYVGSVEYSEEDGAFWGKVVGISDSVTYDGEDLMALEKDFHDAVDVYLEILADRKTYDKAMAEHRANPVTYLLEEVEKMIEEDPNAKH